MKRLFLSISILLIVMLSASSFAESPLDFVGYQFRTPHGYIWERGETPDEALYVLSDESGNSLLVAYLNWEPNEMTTGPGSRIQLARIGAVAVRTETQLGGMEAGQIRWACSSLRCGSVTVEQPDPEGGLNWILHIRYGPLTYDQERLILKMLRTLYVVDEN